ncbi:hypothetical protein K1719_014746 [Acacia pycnantha]|nr:hypothetical protein K1719_014746 [Acacia pycnantha]
MDFNSEEIGAVSGGFLFDLNILPSDFQEISETEHDSIEQQIDEELIHASETNGKEVLEKKGSLPNQIKCDPNIVEEVIKYLSIRSREQN